jgi:hypothetical protein
MAVDYYAISAATNKGTPQATTDIVANTDIRDVSNMLDLLALADTPFIKGFVLAGSVMASAGTSLQISTVEGLTTAQAARQLQTGTLLYHYSSTDGEHSIMALTVVGTDGELEMEVMSTATTFSVSTSTIAGDKLFILGAVANEGSLPRTGNWRSRVVNSNGFSIFRQDVQITGSQKATDMYAIGREDQHQVLMRMKELQREREKSALYSVHVTPRSTTSASLMNGALGFLVSQSGSNIDTSTTSLTESNFNTIIGACWEAGSDNLTFFADRTNAAKPTQWDKNRIRMAPRDGRGGGYVNYYMSECGVEVELVPMRNVPVNIAFLVDTSKCAMRAKKGRKGFMEKLGKVGDMDDWQILSECSLEMKGFNLRQHGLWTRLS